MAINQLLVQSYALNVYRTGKNRLSTIAITRPDYVQPVMQFAADNYYIDDIDTALQNAWITPQEHADTLALKELDDPQYRPVIDSVVNPEESI
jgi:hypothetical protein